MAWVIDSYGTRNGFIAASRSLIPHPAVFVLSPRGELHFRSIDRNYKRRTTMHTLFTQLQTLQRSAT